MVSMYKWTLFSMAAEEKLLPYAQELNVTVMQMKPVNQ